MLASFALALLTFVSAATATPPTITLTGTVTRADKGTYQELPFDLPAGVTRIDVDFSYDNKGKGTELEVGLFDPERFRGTSRFSKDRFHLTEFEATPSYVPGPLPAGRWRLSLGIPSIGAGQSSKWTATVRFSTRSTPVEGLGPVDFFAITDHNTTSHHADLATMQEGLTSMLLLRGQELTTFHGHANIYGTSRVIDFRLGFNGRTMNHVMDDVDHEHALLSINHPGRETGDRCTGCGWDGPATPWDRIASMEVVNGGVIEGKAAACRSGMRASTKDTASRPLAAVTITAPVRLVAASVHRPRSSTRASCRRLRCSMGS